MLSKNIPNFANVWISAIDFCGVCVIAVFIISEPEQFKNITLFRNKRKFFRDGFDF